MIDAIVMHWDYSSGSGEVSSSDGLTYRVFYSNGQTFALDKDCLLPFLSGSHDQLADGHLKVPKIGDPILLQVSDVAPDQVHWGYLRHYLELAERRYGTDFRQSDPAATSQQ
jgi:hypothetical protein